MDKIIKTAKKIFNICSNFINRYEEIIIPTFVMICICFIVTLALSSANLLTADKIASLSKEKQATEMKKVIEAEEYIEASLSVDGKEIHYHTAKNGKNILGYIFITSAKGYGGDISVMTAVNLDGTVKTVSILDASNETPGLGQNVTRDSFYSQFAQRSENVSVVKNGASLENNEINACTGATISSKAVTKAVNEAIEYSKQISKEAKK